MLACLVGLLLPPLKVVDGLGEQAVIGVIPKELTPREVSGHMVGQVHIVDNMHTRKVRARQPRQQLSPEAALLSRPTAGHARLGIGDACRCRVRCRWLLWLLWPKTEEAAERAVRCYLHACRHAAACMRGARPCLFVCVCVKALMAQHADGFIAMPGGFGTLEELLEVITWQQLGFHRKPIGVLNINGFFDPLLAFFSHSVQQVGTRAMRRKCPLRWSGRRGCRASLPVPDTKHGHSLLGLDGASCNPRSAFAFRSCPARALPCTCPALQGFIKQHHADALMVADDPAALLDKMRAFKREPAGLRQRTSLRGVCGLWGLGKWLIWPGPHACMPGKGVGG